jgi:predicted signal transduction protein with EAL and GGDEF domain
LRHGAVDYVLKTNLARLATAVRRALEEVASRRARRKAEERVARLTRVLQMLSGINTAVVRIRDRTQLLEEAINDSLPLDVAWREIPVTLKAGLAHFPQSGANAESLLQNAEAALHLARTSGDRYRQYRRDMSSEVLERLPLEHRLRVALEANQFVLHYQPTIELVSGAIVGAEALLRWCDPVRVLVPPDGFLPVL